MHIESNRVKKVRREASVEEKRERRQEQLINVLTIG